MNAAARIKPVLRWIPAQAPREDHGPEAWIVSYDFEGSTFLRVGRLGSGYLVRAPGVADFRMSEDGTSVEVVPYPGVDKAEIEELFEQVVVPGIDQLAGTPAIHASAVSTPHGAIAFVGPSGAGKSTLAGLLSTKWPLLADDYLPLRIDGDRVVAQPSSTWVRLRGASVERLREQGTIRAGKLAVERPSSQDPQVLSRLYAIGGEADAISIGTCSRRDALVLVASQLLRLDTEKPALLEAELGFVERVIERVPLRVLRYPRSFDVVEAVERAIEEDLMKGSP
ncbi:MAG: hypothetical protein HOW73_13630 [Polyangiaceae bacterium]|nr:hypothetical protein [Polyangiaceae bacterium]